MTTPPRPVLLGDFTDLAEICRENGGSLPEFLSTELVRQLAWPSDVIEQWLYDHAGHHWFLVDYGQLDLSTISWHDERVAAEQFVTMPTGVSEYAVIDRYAEDPDYAVRVRRHQGVPQHWQTHGTWLRRPLLIDRTLLQPPQQGLQVIEGRTRVAVLRGYLRLDRDVAPTHAAWVARPATPKRV